MTYIIKEERIGGQRLILGDCMKVMPELGGFDAVVTDPPYGINYTGNGGRGWVNRNATFDEERPTIEVFNSIREISSEQIIWGGNYFTDYLPPSMRWLIWDKGQRGFSLADCEVAWTSQNKAMRIFDYARAKALRDGKKHPTQKPVALMEWCLGFLPTAVTILDPFAGSGTTAVACERMGRQCTAIELDPDYFGIMCRRVDEQVRQPRLELPEPPHAAVQEDLF